MSASPFGDVKWKGAYEKAFENSMSVRREESRVVESEHPDGEEKEIQNDCIQRMFSTIQELKQKTEQAKTVPKESREISPA